MSTGITLQGGTERLTRISGTLAEVSLKESMLLRDTRRA
jgi:hypothetical protein